MNPPNPLSNLYNLYLNNSYSYPFADEEKQNIKLKYNLNKLKKYQTGDEIGNIEIYIADERINTFPIYIRKNEEMKVNKNIFQKLMDWIRKLW